MVATITRARNSAVERALEACPAEVALTYARLNAGAQHRTEHTAEKSLLFAWPGARKLSQPQRRAVCHALDQRPDVMAECARVRDLAFSAACLGKHERRSILATIARAPVDPESVEPRDVIAASRLDGELAQEPGLARGGAQVQIASLGPLIIKWDGEQPKAPRALGPAAG